MPLRKKSSGQSQRSDQKENLQLPSQSSFIADQASSMIGSRPLSPRLVRCQSDNTQRIVPEDQLSVHSHSNGSISKSVHRTFSSLTTKAKLANLTELNNTLVREVASLRSSRSEAVQKLSELNGEMKCLMEEKSVMASSISELQQNLRSLQHEMAEKLNSFSASEKRFLSANAHMDEVNSDLRAQISALSIEKEDLLSERHALLSEKLSAETKIEALERSLAECMIKEREMHRSLHLLKVELSEANERIHDMASQVETANAEKHKIIQDHGFRTEEMSSKYKEMEERVKTMSKNTDLLKEKMQMDKKNLEEEVLQLRDDRTALISEKSSILMECQSLQERLYSSVDREEELKRSLSALKVKMEVDQNRHEASVKAMEAEAERSSVQSSSLISFLKQSLKNDVETLRMKLVEEEKKSDVLKSELSRMEVSFSSISFEKQQLERCKASLEAKVITMEQEICNQVQSARDQLASSERERDGMMKKMSNIEASYSKLEGMKASVDKELIAEKQRRSVAEENNTALRGQVENLKHLNSKLLERVRSIQSQLDVEVKARILAEDALASMVTSFARNQKVDCQLESHKSDLASMEAMSAKQAKHEDEYKKCPGDHSGLNQELAGLAAVEKDALVSKEVLSDGNIMEIEKISASIEALSSEKTRVEAEMEKLVYRCAELQEEVSLVAAEKEAALASMQELRTENTNLIDEKEKLRHEFAREVALASASIEALSEEKVKLEASNSTLMSTCQKALEELEVERETQVLAQCRFSSEIDGLNSENNKLITINNDLMSTIMILEGKVKHLLSEERKREEQNSILSKQIADYTEAMEALSALLDTKKDEVRGLMVERNDVSEKLVAMQKELEAVRGMNSALEKKVELALREKMTLEERMISELSVLQAKIKSLECELEEKECKHGNFELQVNFLQNQLDVSMDRALRADAEINRMASLLSEANKEITSHGELELRLDSLQKELEVLGKRASKAEAERDITVSKLLEATKKITILEEDIAKRKRTHGNLELEIISLQKELEVSNNRALRVKAERDVIISDLSDANAKIKNLEGEVAKKVRSRGELELELTSLQHDFKDLNSGEAERLEVESREIKSPALEEQLEMPRTSGVHGGASVDCLQMQSGSLGMEEKKTNQNQTKSKRKKKHSSAAPDTTNSAVPSNCLEMKSCRSAIAQKPEVVGKSAMDERAKIMRLALPVVLISAASSMVVAGIQSYLRRIEN